MVFFAIRININGTFISSLDIVNMVDFFFNTMFMRACFIIFGIYWYRGRGRIYVYRIEKGENNFGIFFLLMD